MVDDCEVSTAKKVIDRRQIKRCPMSPNYPATAAFSGKTYKIYAVRGSKKYKSNIFKRSVCYARERAMIDGSCRGRVLGFGLR
jgi:hypothetical protein